MIVDEDVMIIIFNSMFRYCGACSAFAYKQIDPRGFKRVFVMGENEDA